MNTITPLKGGPQPRSLYLFLLCLTALWSMSRSAGAQLYVAQDGSASVGEYNATNGAAINANLIRAGVNSPAGLALSGNTLFVANSGANTVGKYTVNATMVTESNPTFISTGLSTPTAVAVSGSHLFVVNENGNQTIREYDVNTGIYRRPVSCLHPLHK